MNHRWFLLTLGWMLSSLSQDELARAQAQAPGELRVSAFTPADMKVGRLSALCFDAQGRGYVLVADEDGGSILMLEDVDEDGRADRTTVFAKGLETVGVGADADIAGSLLAHGGDVYAAIAPSLWRLSDLDADGVADERAEIVRGFGGQDLRGLTLGPDGKLYLAVDDRGLSVADHDGQQHQLSNQGAVVRCDPDGGNFEVVARGLRNPSDLAFDSSGNLFLLDHPAGGADRERLHYLLEGSDAGWRSYYRDRENEGYSAWKEESLWKTSFPGQTAAITPGLVNLVSSSEHDGSVDFALHPGTALSEAFEEHFFLAYPSQEKVNSFRLEPDTDAVGFLMVDASEALEGRRFYGMRFGTDGALYGAGSDDSAANAVHRMDVAEAQRHPMREETIQWFKEDFQRLPEGRLLGLLGYPDQRVRLAAQYEIARRGDFTILRQTAIADSRRIARIHGIWGCAQIVRQREGESLQGIASLVRHRDPEIRAQMLKALGETRSRFALEVVKDGMFDSNPRVRMHAALALHYLAGPKDLKDITDYIVANGDEDVFRRHAGVRALTGAARGWPELLVDLHEHHSSVVRLVAAVALRRLHETMEEGKAVLDDQDQEAFSGLAKFLADESETVVVEAARGIHDVGHPNHQALSALAAMLETTTLSRAPLVRRMINANRLLADDASARRLLRFASMRGGGVADELRAEAFASAATWMRKLDIDPVLGVARMVPAGSSKAIGAALDAYREALLGLYGDDLQQLIQGRQ